MPLKPQLKAVAFDRYRPSNETELCALDTLCEPVRQRLAWAERHTPLDPKGLFVALQGARVIGSAALRVAPHRVGEKIVPVGYLADVAVHPDFRRQGLAQALSEKALGYAEARECHGVVLYTDKHTNAGAYQLYQSLGFAEFTEVALFVWGNAGGPSAESDLIVRPAQDSDRMTVLTLLEQEYKNHALWCPDSPWRFGEGSLPPKAGLGTYVVKKSGVVQGTFGLFSYEKIWRYQTPAGWVAPLAIHNAAKGADLSERELWSAIGSFLSRLNGSFPMIGVFADLKEKERVHALGQTHFQKFQDGQWYFKPLRPQDRPLQGPVYMGFPL